MQLDPNVDSCIAEVLPYHPRFPFLHYNCTIVNRPGTTFQYFCLILVRLKVHHNHILLHFEDYCRSSNFQTLPKISSKRSLFIGLPDANLNRANHVKDFPQLMLLTDTTSLPSIFAAKDQSLSLMSCLLLPPLQFNNRFSRIYNFPIERIKL